MYIERTICGTGIWIVVRQMGKTYKVAGYVKLAKLWERTGEEAFQYHNEYFHNKYDGADEMELVGVYVDITGQKEIRKRPEMIRLLSDCVNGRINCISTQTKAYLAANNREFFYLLHFLFELKSEIAIVTEDKNYHINTIENPEKQKEALRSMVNDYVNLNPADYSDWRMQIYREINKVHE